MLKKYQWHKVAETKEELHVQEKGVVAIDAAGKKMCLAMHNSLLYACAHKCPHAGGLLEEGWVDATGNIVCPLHRYKFSLEKGRNVSAEGYYLKTFPVEERPDGVYVGVESTTFFGW